MSKKIIPVFLIAFLFLGWGKTGHKIINEKSILSFSSELDFLKSWSNILIEHASDADNRKNDDPSESPKHFIDIDEYNEFLLKNKIIEDFDSIVAKYGSSTVIDRGLLPWAIQVTVDSLTSSFRKKDWNGAMLRAADLGHYVADAHMPLHITKNYNGQFTGQTGVHSRYESTMIGYHSGEIIYEGKNIQYVNNISDYTFDFIYNNYQFVDSVLIADKTAKNDAGGNYNSVYYQKLWLYTKDFTIDLYYNASWRLAELIYTAWINAGSPTITELEESVAELEDFNLYQNYPNPFNPTTTIEFTIPAIQNINVSLKVYNVLGREIKTLINDEKLAGKNKVTFDASDLVSGVYFYTLRTSNGLVTTRKMVLVK